MRDYKLEIRKKNKCFKAADKQIGAKLWTEANRDKKIDSTVDVIAE